MPNYTYYCETCDWNFDDLCTFEESKEDKSCPTCGTVKCPRTYDLSKSDNKTGVYVGTKGQINYHDITSLKAQEKEFMHGAIDGTKEALKANKGKSPYSKVTLNYKVLEERGIVKKVDKEHAEGRINTANLVAQEAAKKMTPEEIKRAGTRGDNHGIG
tara:strand:+ start:4645 stop:5118 length:474 start_codon:yes stop_codon:yes gene_type:complete